MIHIIGIGPGNPELLTLKAARLLSEADIVYVPQSNGEARSVSTTIIAPHVHPDKIRPVVISMRTPVRGADPVYATLAQEIAAQAAKGLTVAFVSMGDILVYSTGQYLGRELAALGASYEYVSGLPSFIAAAALAGVPLASGTEGILIIAMPDNLEALCAVADRAETVVLMKVNKRLPVLLEYVRRFSPATAILLHRVGLEEERMFDLNADAPALPEHIGYLSIVILRRQ